MNNKQITVTSPLLPSLEEFIPYLQEIWNRPTNYDAEHENWNKNMLIELADINNKKSLAQWKKQYLSKALKQITYFHWHAAMSNLRIWRFIDKQRYLVENSRNTNKSIGNNWL